MTLALLFPGQGTQHPEMLRWLDGDARAAPVLATMAAAIGSDWRSRLADADWASRNGVAQVLLTGTSLAAWSCIALSLPRPAVVAGYSVGELAAYAAAGVFDPTTAVDLAGDRAAAMDRAAAGADGGMLSVTGAGAAAVDAACRRHGLAVAIEIAEDRRIVGGDTAALDAAAAELVAAGAQCRRLAIRVASHTPAMRAAADAFGERLRGVVFARPRSTIVTDLDGAAIRGVDDLRAALAGQIAATVRWSRCIDAAAERLPRCVVEVGPGTTLSKLWNEVCPAVPARSVDEFRSADAAAAWVRGVLDRPG